MGVVVAVEFTGPLAVAIAASRRPVDYLWVLLALCGLLLLVPWQAGLASADAAGLGLALLSGLGWAGYIVFGTRAGAAHGGSGVALGMILSAMLILPVGGAALVAAAPGWMLLATGLAVALLSSAIPYVLEIHAMQALPTRTFGILMSVEPAIATLVGLIVLGEQLSMPQLTGIAGVAAERIRRALKLPADVDGLTEVLRLHPLLNPAGYVVAEIDDGRLQVHPAPAHNDGAWISLCSPASTEPLQAIATAVDPHLVVRITGSDSDWTAEFERTDTPGKDSPEVEVTKFSLGATFEFEPRRSLPLTVL
jgi:hypothetical protein